MSLLSFAARLTRRPSLRTGRTATPIRPFTMALAGTPVAALLAGPREIPVAAIASLIAPEVSTERRIELVEAMAASASDRGVLAEHYLPWFLTMRQAVTLLAADPGVAVTTLAPLRWKVVECAARVGLAADVRQHAEEALDVSPMTPALLANMLEWRVGSRGATLEMLAILEPITVDGVEKARRHFTNFLREFAHA